MAESHKIILCIDDMPNRYNKLSKLSQEIGIVAIVTCRLEEVNFYLEGPYNIYGICLDHDMPVVGTYFAQHVLPNYYPVAITSANPSGARKIQDILNERNFDFHQRIAASGSEWAKRVLEFFAESWRES